AAPPKVAAMQHPAYRLVPAVHQPAASLARLAVEPRVRAGVHTAADAVRRLIDRRADAGVLEGERGVQTGDAATHDGDAPLAGGRPGRGECRRRAKGGRPRGHSGRLQEIAAREAALTPLAAHLGHRAAGAVRLLAVLGARPRRSRRTSAPEGAERSACSKSWASA